MPTSAQWPTSRPSTPCSIRRRKAAGSRMEDTSSLRIVAMGGGTGLSSVLEGLKHYTRPGDPSAPAVDITAIVTVTDDGGSSGRLRREFDVLPPGDIRNCMVALSEDSALLSRLFQHRFTSGRGLKGHSFGNLFLMCLTQIMGDFPAAIKASSEVLKIAGRIYPATTGNVVLEATLEDGSRVVGETRISRSRSRIKAVRLRPRKVRPLAAALSAIADADLKTYFVNLMGQPGETLEFRASDHVRALQQHAGGKFLDYVVVNIRAITSAMKKRYARQAALPVENDLDAIF